MLMLGPLGFTAPWLLLGLIVLPALWLILRAVPPAPVRRRFPGVALLLGLGDREAQADRTPWWLMLLRMLALAALIAGFAGPILNPTPQPQGSGPLLVIADGTWADARDWDSRVERMQALLTEAQRAGQPSAVAVLTELTEETPAPEFTGAEAVLLRLPSLQPQPYAPDAEALSAWADRLEGEFDTLWLSDGLERDSRAPLLAALQDHGSVSVYQVPRQTLGLRPAAYENGEIAISAVRTPTGPATTAELSVIGLDPAGVERQLATAPLDFAPGEAVAQVALTLPPELRNRVTRFEIAGQRSAGTVALADDGLRRREVALIEPEAGGEGLDLLSPLHYLREALEPTSDLIEGGLDTAIPANPDVIVLADEGALPAGQDEALQGWVEDGGLLLRFAGPRLAASDVARLREDPLLPVRLRAGGRNVGGAMSWGEPKTMAPFDEDSPFYGLPVPRDVTVSAQVMAQPDPDLADRVIAQLADGTPLVTRKALGEGQVVLFHVTANAEWSSLPLAGLFPAMLERLAVTSRQAPPEAGDLDGTVWMPDEVLDARGTLSEAETLPGVPGERIAGGSPGPDMPPGLYAGEDRRLAVNVLERDATLAPAAWPGNVTVEGLSAARELPLKGWLLGGALMLLLVDVIAALLLAGRLRGPVAAALALMMLALPQGQAQAQPAEQRLTPQEEAFAAEATDAVVLAHVLTGDAEVDDLAQAGLTGLSRSLFQRSSIEPAAPMGVDIETDELAFFPLLYWPVTPDAPLPSPQAYDKLNAYLRGGGMILFDTRDADTAGYGSETPEGRRLQAIARPLDIPPIEPIPADHVLTRTFYLLQAFPGRYEGPIWVETSRQAQAVEGMPFRDLNDNVSPVVIGGNDWASAWAVDDAGLPLRPVGRGQAGERQREMALRFGMNLVMHVLTGNYKSDQVHVPALLERLGQ
ncbi:DUF4159 domain-containing protein [Pseudoroseicyclus aestuarii]|uniref:Putative membrane protein (TIGR02226 family) n=1 Tax=Pseudoroseicyclus aestuarii TaxID=1795041 RepID=A0A318SVF2_9RHOB|nr:DUF4159 domain-containing protein [Pseudoroseicyclus aestuarii]PYE83837.1 putative membrane protein (TIGR02226 family) [Pseudoroseicyclus aestuarii]